MTHSRQHRPEIVVGLVATPPDHPAQVVARPTAELSDRPADRMNADLQWTVRQGWGDVAPRRDGGAERYWKISHHWKISRVGATTKAGTSRSA